MHVEKSPMKVEYSLGLGNYTYIYNYLQLSRSLINPLFTYIGFIQLIYLSFEFGLPGNINEVNANTVRNHQRGEISDIT